MFVIKKVIVSYFYILWNYNEFSKGSEFRIGLFSIGVVSLYSDEVFDIRVVYIDKG